VTLQALRSKGSIPARRLMKALILLKADVSDAGEGWSDSEIISALDTNKTMVYGVRKQRVEEGLDAVLSRKVRATPPVGAHLRRRDGGQADRPGLFSAPGRLCALELAAAGGEGRRTEYR
jgi:hypothetical protein